MSLVIVGDVHIKSHPLYLNAQIKFLDWLLENHKNDTIIQTGDFFNNSSIHHDIMYQIVSILSNFKDFRIIEGNHDKSFRLGSILKNLKHHSNITVYEDIAEIEIDNHKCLMLPYKYNMSDYEELTGEYDFIFCHFTPREESFGGEFINIDKLKGKKIYGHIHIQKDYPDALIIGTPLITRNGEQNNPIIEIDKQGNINKIEVPKFFDIQTITYGEKIENFDYLYNITGAPSTKSVYDLYPMINIRSAGIQVVFSSDEDQEIMLNKLDNDLSKLYSLFCKERDIDKEYESEGLTAINECVEGV